MASPSSSSSFLPTGSLIDSLVHISHEVSSITELPLVQVKNISTMVRRVKLLSSLFEEIQNMKSPVPPVSILCLTELFSVIRRVKFLIQECQDGSSLWNFVQTEFLSKQFHVLVMEMGNALDILPLSLLDVSADVREQIELLHKQTKRANIVVDDQECQKRDELLQVMTNNNGKKRGIMDCKKVEKIMSDVGLRSSEDFEGEISRLEAEAQKQAGTGGLIVVSNINNLVSLVSYSKSVIFRDSSQDLEKKGLVSHDDSSYSSFTIPDEYRCPISLELMRDPVIVASGHTYDRNSIAQWINSGHHSCPKSGQKLIHMALIPNYALKSLIHQWCQESNIPLKDDESSSSSSSSSSSQLERTTSKRKLTEKATDHISATKTAMDAVRMTAEFLVGKIATGSPDVQKQATYELRLLAKTGMDNRRIIAEAGAIPFLVTLLTTNDPRIQENAVTALLNLSIFDNNKVLIMAAGAIDSIIQVLQSGKTMEARENAAAAIFSLSMIDDCKVAIGAKPRAIPALVGLLKDGTTIGKRDAATALFNLAVYNANKASVVIAGAVPLLIQLLVDDKAGITDDALAVLALLSGCAEGLEEIRDNRVVVPLLIDLLKLGSPKGKENSVTLLLGLCKRGGEEVARRLLVHPHSIPSLQSLVSDGSLKARRKADSLLRLLNRYCSQSHLG
ncbi:E3 ubiquitin-protein ligase pub1 [Ranunculus cassubicifolius]